MCVLLLSRPLKNQYTCFMGGKLSFFRFNSLLVFYSTEILFHFLGKEEDLLQKGDCPFFKEDKVSRLTFVITNKITISIYD